MFNAVKGATLALIFASFSQPSFSEEQHSFILKKAQSLAEIKAFRSETDCVTYSSYLTLKSQLLDPASPNVLKKINAGIKQREAFEHLVEIEKEASNLGETLYVLYKSNKNWDDLLTKICNFDYQNLDLTAQNTYFKLEKNDQLFGNIFQSPILRTSCQMYAEFNSRLSTIKHSSTSNERYECVPVKLQNTIVASNY